MKLNNFSQRFSVFLGYLILATIPFCFGMRHENFNIFELNKQLLFVTILVLVFGTWLLNLIVTSNIKLVIDQVTSAITLILLIFLITQSFFSLNPSTSFFGNYMRQQGVLIFLHYYFWFFWLQQLWIDKRRIVGSLIAIALGSVPVISYGFIQRLGLDPLSWIEPSSARVFASLGQPNFLGAYLGMTMLLCSALLLQIRHWVWRLLLLIIVILQLAVLVFTQSRGSWLSLLVALILITVLYLLKKRYYLLIVIGGIMITTSLVALVIFNNTLSQIPVVANSSLQRFVSSFDIINPRYSIKARMITWSKAWQIYSNSDWNRKIFGWGKDSQELLFIKTYMPDWAYYEKIHSYPDRAHNLVLDILLEFGLIGLLLFGGLSSLIVTRALVSFFRSNDKSLDWLLLFFLGSAFCYLFNHSFSFPVTTHYVYYYYILSVLIALSQKHSYKEYRIRSSKLAIALVSLSLLLFYLIMVYQYYYRYFIADYYFIRAKTGEARGDCNQALYNINRTIKWKPDSPNYQEQFLLLYNNCLTAAKAGGNEEELRNNLRIQLEVMEKQINQHDYTIIKNIANTYSLFGLYFDQKYYAQAEFYYLKLINLSPNILISYLDYGRMKQWSGDNEVAIKIFKEALLKSPDYTDAGRLKYRTDGQSFVWDLKQQLADSYYNLKKYQEALDLYLELVPIYDNADIYIRLADTYCGLKNYKLCEASMDTGSDKEAYSVEARIRMAEYYQQQGNYSRALQYAESVKNLDPTNTKAKQIILDLKMIKK